MESNKPINRGEKTRDALLTAAMEAFGKAGYDAAGNRAIADAAGANQALIGYHFGGKRGLYLAVFEHITEQMQLELLPLLATLEREISTIRINDPGCAQRCTAAIQTLLNAILDILSRPESKTWARLVMREQQDPSDAFEILYKGLMKRILGTLSSLAAMAEGFEIENDTARLRAIFLISQVLIFAMAPAVVGRHMNWEGGAPANLDTVKTNLDRILHQQFIGEPSP